MRHVALDFLETYVVCDPESCAIGKTPVEIVSMLFAGYFAYITAIHVFVLAHIHATYRQRAFFFSIAVLA